MNKKYFYSLFMALCAGFSLKAQFKMSDVQFWVGTGKDSSVLVVDFQGGQSNNSFAWGYLHSGATAEMMLNAVAAADPNFKTKIGGGFLSDITYKTHAGIGGNPDWWSTWSGTSVATFGMNGGISASLSNGEWFGCSYTDFSPPLDIREPAPANPPLAYKTIDPVACSRYISPSHKYTWTKSGQYKDTLRYMSGTDSVFLTINLTVKPGSSASFNVIACGSYISPSKKFNWRSSGTFNDTITNVTGCDSVMIFNVTIKPRSSSGISPVVCGSYVSPSGKYIWASSGVYRDTLTNIKGCDSVITVILTVNKKSNSVISPLACGSYVSPSGKYTWKNSGTYADTITNKKGCDSVVTIHLTIKNGSSSTINPRTCNRYVSPSRKYTWTTSGTFSDTISNTWGCDSVITINLALNGNSSTSNISPVACGSYISPSRSYSWSKSGVYHDTVTNTNGCDSFITINLTVNHASTSSIRQFACQHYVSPSGKYVWTTSGTYSDTILNKQGCDSIISVNLSIQKVDVSVSVSGNVLTAAAQGAAYKWLDCNNNFAPVPNEIFAVFTAVLNGSYAVEISQGNCVDTSECISVNPVSVYAATAGTSIKIFPNPAQDELTVSFNDGELHSGTIVLYNALGSVVFSCEISESGKAVIAMQDYTHGVYTLAISTNNNSTVYQKIIKQ